MIDALMVLRWRMALSGLTIRQAERRLRESMSRREACAFLARNRDKLGLVPYDG